MRSWSGRVAGEVPGRVTPVPPVSARLRASLAMRLYAWVRARTCPFHRIEPLVPRCGVIVDFGCGCGLLAARLRDGSGARRIVALDPDAARIAMARSLHGSERICWQVLDGSGIPPCHAVVLVDVLYLMPPEVQRELLRAIHESLLPGGLLLLKVMGDSPAWKVSWDRVQDFVVMRLLGRRRAVVMHHVPMGVLGAWLSEVGFEVEGRDISAGYPHPHHLLVARRLLTETTEGGGTR